MARFFVERAGLRLAVEDVGDGRPVLFQHGLGADARQVAEVFPTGPAMRRITLECRAQGESDAGPAAALSIATFSDDVAWLAEHLRLRRAIFGGISLGAAVALRLAVRRPDLVGGLILARPAWLFKPGPENMLPYARVGALLGHRDPEAARAAFLGSEVAARLAAEAPDNLASLLRFFDHPAPKTLAVLLQAIAADGPGVTEAEAKAIAVPTLVIGHGEDLAHPFAYAERLAGAIPGARLARITSKVVDRSRYVAEFRAAIIDFIGAVDG
ncbi:MAG TPA: alpha/beta fold hydrolase [Dongiaceae bacterium]|nr:alpha/beta fold hydrolase [Dongiaceae bacterium]